MKQYMVDVKGLRSAMALANIRSKTELAEKSNVNRNTIGTLLDGKSLPTLSVLYRIAGALDLSPEDAGKLFIAEAN